MSSYNLKHLVAHALVIIFLSILSINCKHQDTGEAGSKSDTTEVFNNAKLKALLGADEWMAPDTSSIPQSDEGNLIRYGRLLIANTAEYFGPGGKINQNANGMNCQNCHLEAGTKLYANSYSAVASIYPKWRPRSGTVEHLEKRINDCMERSLNGGKLDSLDSEMRAMVAYINWVGKDVKKGVTPKGASVADLVYLDRPADPEKGKIIFQQHCVRCHGNDGSGKLNADNITYLYPPLWGLHSYNTGAGAYRLSRFAGFIKSNMPQDSSSFDKPILADEEAWDIAAYVNSMPRPNKKFKNDWPDISKKPVDHPFGPYIDKFSETQHKYGPFEEIIKAIKK